MKRTLANPSIRVMAFSLLGIGTVFLPWCRLTIFGAPAYISGYSLWQGKTVGVLFLVIAVLTVLLRESSRCKATAWIGCGTVIAVVSTQFLFQILMPTPTRIEVQH